MEQHNWWLNTQLTRQRYADIRREAQHGHVLAEHGLDLWSVLRRAIRRRLARPATVPRGALAAPTACAAEDGGASIAA